MNPFKHWRKATVALLFVGLGLAAGSQMGSGTPPQPTPTPTSPPQPLVASTIDVGGHSCAVQDGSAGNLYCWGPNDQGQLGSSTPTCLTVPCSRVPLAVPGISNVSKVSVGQSHTCAVTTSGQPWCWGDNFYGQLGNGTTASSATPVQPAGLGTVSDISAGIKHTCAILTSGGIRCWGDNTSGQLGDGSFTQGLTPVAATINDSSSNRWAISTGWEHTCVISNGQVWCWGDNTYGQLGSGQFCPQICDTTLPRMINPNFFGNGVFVQLLTAGSGQNCARISQNFAVKCWGQNDQGQLGVGDLLHRSLPTNVIGMSGSLGSTGVQQLSGGTFHTCAVVQSSLKCWGSNDAGQLGDGTANSSTSPVSILNISDVSNVSAGFRHACGRTNAGSVLCWGNNLDGQVGDGTETTAHTSPVPVAPVSP